MNSLRQNMGLALLVWAFMLGVSARIPADAQDGLFYQSHTVRQGRLTLQLASKSPKATSIAKERYRFVHWFESQPGNYWPINEVIGSHQDTVLFPFGRSDRMYVVFWPDGRGREEMSTVSCYQQKDGKYKLVYEAGVEEKDTTVPKGTPAKKLTPFRNLLDWLTEESEYDQGGVGHLVSYLIRGSKFAKNDLARTQEYVEYDEPVPMDTLEVALFSQRRRYGPEETYGLESDPFTRKKLWLITGKGGWTHTSDGFFQRYGLPVTKTELSVLSH